MTRRYHNADTGIGLEIIEGLAVPPFPNAPYWSES